MISVLFEYCGLLILKKFNNNNNNMFKTDFYFYFSQVQFHRHGIKIYEKVKRLQ